MTTKTNHLTNESLESTRRMVQMTNDSLNTGVKTMTMLEEQGETLQNVEREMDQIKQDMKQARKNLNELSKCCGLCLCPCNRLKSTESDWRKKQVRKPKESKQKVVSSQPTSAFTGPYINRITNDEREEEMEGNLSQVVHHVEILKNMALDLSNKIEDQIQIIDHVNDEITTITSEVAAAEKQARKHR
ncbi:synaptosomal-associated protein 23-like [Puntigrus tetrazona]|uniref:synaptosomal-associated protein 23-like n=1 Tax=Puntigrus tetrazona TaxID=1606681 RepID=UPI001C88F7EB|nr:synaptosomal-associated protein 23-like [Puntigrus tetrazona]XP_043118905.1 synaptosomal-associated protein 23-like [Puntigrus tetrazona]